MLQAIQEYVAGKQVKNPFLRLDRDYAAFRSNEPTERDRMSADIRPDVDNYGAGTKKARQKIKFFLSPLAIYLQREANRTVLLFITKDCVSRRSSNNCHVLRC
jgi:hypothetical protein